MFFNVYFFNWLKTHIQYKYERNISYISQQLRFVLGRDSKKKIKSEDAVFATKRVIRWFDLQEIARWSKEKQVERPGRKI